MSDNDATAVSLETLVSDVFSSFSHHFENQNDIVNKILQKLNWSIL